MAAGTSARDLLGGRVHAALEGQRQERYRGQFGDVGLGRRDRPLRSGGQVHGELGGADQRRVRFVGDGDGQGPLATRILHHPDDVRRAAGLRDAHHEGPGDIRGAAVEAHQRRRSEGHGQAVPGAKDVLRVGGRVIGRAAGGDQGEGEVSAARG